MNKIKRRFTAYEKAVLADGRDVNALSEEEKEGYYRAVKRRKRNEAETLVIGGVAIRNNLFLAPLAGYTNYPFRRICERSGAGLAFTEMVSAKGLKYGSETPAPFCIRPKRNPPAPCSCSAASGRHARGLRERGTFPLSRRGHQHGLPRAQNLQERRGERPFWKIRRSRKRSCPSASEAARRVTVKMRIGVSADKLVSAEFAKRMEGAGAALVTVHGRTRDKYYSGEVNAAEIAAVKRSVKIPVIANGGVFSVADADRLLDETGADGVMIARGGAFRSADLLRFYRRPAGKIRKR